MPENSPISLTEITETRLSVLRNGYTPLPNLDKICRFAGWPTVEVNEAEIRRWGRMRAYEATGLRIENGLMALDFDINHGDVTQLYERIETTFPELGRALVRQGKGWKEAWFLRVSEPFSRYATATFAAPSGEGCMVEAFGGGSPRQFGALGWHTKGEREYYWVDDRSPVTVPLADLPEITLDRVREIVDFCTAWFLEEGWDLVSDAHAGLTEPEAIWDLTEDMTFDTREDGTLSLDELRERVNGRGYYYCSASFADGPIARNTRRCSISLDHDGGISIWDSMTDVTHHEAGRERAELTDEVAAELTDGLAALGLDVADGTVVRNTPIPGMETPSDVVFDRYIRTERGAHIKPMGENVAVWLQEHLPPGTLKLNQMTGFPWIMNDGEGVFRDTLNHGYPRQISDADDRRLKRVINTHLQPQLGASFGMGSIKEGVGMYADDHPYDPLIEFFGNLPAWDGQPRLNTWLFNYAGAVADDSHSERYISSVGRKWLISAVARAMKPGTKVDNILILFGPQSDRRLGKSSLLRALAGSFAPGPDGLLFGDDMPALTRGADDKKAKEWMQGVWIAEVAEMTAIAKADVDQVKGFISGESDRYRVPYDDKPRTVYRRTVFCATTNHREFLADSTGNRRFWPVPAFGRINVKGLRSVVDQIWAEAKVAYETGEKWYFAPDAIPQDDVLLDDVATAQLAATKTDMIVLQVVEKLEYIEDDALHDTKCPTMLDIYREAVDPLGKSVPRDAMHKIAEAINKAGWSPVPQGANSKKAKRYRRGPDARPFKSIAVTLEEVEGGMQKIIQLDEAKKRPE